VHGISSEDTVLDKGGSCAPAFAAQQQRSKVPQGMPHWATTILQLIVRLEQSQLSHDILNAIQDPQQANRPPGELKQQHQLKESHEDGC
jgi:hypothetical protein